MKQLTLLLTAVLVLAFVNLNAQFHLEKRHYLKGYYLDYTAKKSPAKNLKSVNQTRLSYNDVAALQKEAVREEPTTVILPVISSPALNYSDAYVPNNDLSVAKSKVNRVAHFKQSLRNLPATFRKGAGLILPALHLKKQPAVSTPAVQDVGGGFAIAGFVIGCVAIVGLFNGGVFGLLAVVGLIFSILGMTSGRRGLATAGVILNAIVLIALLVAVLFVTSYNWH